ncbi:hypothetical protein [Mycobacterium sp. IS-1556]|uniref:hypothetical protein n=1 Tax=Mycobacterium sp. IS-1556 TaxID=1772276 RepID=UPI000AC0FED2|nr:hypothetical protein [Mycobacterium sp. IS-1556]
MVDANSSDVALRFDDGDVFAMSASLAAQIGRSLLDATSRRPRAVSPAKARFLPTQ